MNIDEQLNALNNLRKIKRIFDREHIRYWLDAGTLLCAYRDGSLEYEHDTDIGMFVEDFSQIIRLEKELNQEYQNSIGMFMFDGKNPVITSWGNKDIVHGDIMYWYPIGNYRYCHGEHLPFSVPNHLFDSFTNISFENLDSKLKFPVPEKTEEYIEFYYGKDWKNRMSVKQYCIKMVDVQNRRSEPYPINIPRLEIIAFKNKILNGEFNGRVLWDKK